VRRHAPVSGELGERGEAFLERIVVLYRGVKIMSVGRLVGLESTEYGRQMWSKRAARGQRTRRCADCASAIVAKTICWGEVTACALNRHARICDPCMSRLMRGIEPTKYDES